MTENEKCALKRKHRELKTEVENLKKVLTTFIAWSVTELGRDNAMKLLDMLEGKTGTPKSISG
tara:strand:+ start:7237 stop:7425 length:189 start_codon:yes stop_codon:yes gene_type:complete